MLTPLVRWLCLILLGSVPFSAFAAETVMDEKMQTWCFGRYLIDVPMEARTLGGANEYLGTRIYSEKMTRGAFQEMVTKRVEDIKAGYGPNRRKYSTPDGRVLEKKIAVGEDGVILTSWWAPSSNKYYYLESFKFDRGRVFMTSKDLLGAKNTDVSIRRFTEFVQTVRFRSENEIPKEPGICLEHGFIANGEDMETTEEASIAFRLENNQDVLISIKSSYVYQEWPSLLEREREAAQKGGLSRLLLGKVKKIRSGSRKINGMPGEESLVTYPSDDKTGMAHAFAWETSGELRNPDKPMIRLELYSGHKGSGNTGVSSMETSDLLKLFDTIAGTIRIRPTGDAALPVANSGE